MDLSKAVACTALVIIVVVSAGHALSQDKPLAVAALDKTQEMEDLQITRERAAEQKRLARKQIDEEISKRCAIKPVMTDPEIDSCRAAYRLY